MLLYHKEFPKNTSKIVFVTTPNVYSFVFVGIIDVSTAM